MGSLIPLNPHNEGARNMPFGLSWTFVTLAILSFVITAIIRSGIVASIIIGVWCFILKTFFSF